MRHILLQMDFEANGHCSSFQYFHSSNSTWTRTRGALRKMTIGPWLQCPEFKSVVWVSCLKLKKSLKAWTDVFPDNQLSPALPCQLSQMSEKGAKNTRDVRQFNIGDVVLGIVRGYPPWPAMVLDPTEIPPNVLSEQPPPSKKVTFYCVLFFPMGDYAWLRSKDMSLLKKHEMEAFLADENKKRNRDLCEGYRHALDPKFFVDKLKEDRAAFLQELKELEREQVDQLESEPDDNQDDDSKTKPEVTTASKKRKRESGVELKQEKDSKVKKGAAEHNKKESAADNGRVNESKAMGKSEDEGDNAEEDVIVDDDRSLRISKRASPPLTKEAKRDKDDGDDSKNSTMTDPQVDQVRDWRRRLQKAFFSNDAPPKSESMPEIDGLFTTVENYESMTIEQLQHSKIWKLMRHIAAIDDGKIPRDDDFNFRIRAKNLVYKWHPIVITNKPTASSDF